MLSAFMCSDSCQLWLHLSALKLASSMTLIMYSEVKFVLPETEGTSRGSPVRLQAGLAGRLLEGSVPVQSKSRFWSWMYVNLSVSHLLRDSSWNNMLWEIYCIRFFKIQYFSMPFISSN